MQTRPTHTYLFEAELRDGSVIKQTLEDKSATDPARSAFYDIATRIDEVVRFQLVRIKEPTFIYMVDLETGVFFVNGVPFQAHPQYFIPSTKPQLAYEWETTVKTHLSGTVQADGSVPWEENEDKREHYIARYFFGWVAKDGKGKEVRYIIGVPGD